MKPDENNLFEKNIEDLANRIKYPQTPDISASVRAKLESSRAYQLVFKKLVVALILIAVLVAFAVPVVRARLAGFFQIGVVRVVPINPTIPPVEKVTISPPLDTLPPLLNLVGKTTLELARKDSPFSILLPAYPPNLGLPDFVYFQSSTNLVILVWLDPKNPQKVSMSLHEMGPDAYAIKKMNPTVIQETAVGAHFALWTTGPYIVELKGNDFESFRLLEGHTLIWADADITYRLETDLSLQEAIKIGESLR